MLKYRVARLACLGMALLFFGCSERKVKVKESSDLSEAIVSYGNGAEDKAAESAIQEMIYESLPIGSPESEVRNHIIDNFEGDPPSTEKGGPPSDSYDYLYRVEAYRNRVQVWYFIKDKRLVEVDVVNVHAHL